jgi:hypothetical protein
VIIKVKKPNLNTVLPVSVIIIQSEVPIVSLDFQVIYQAKIYSGTRNIVILWALVDNFFYNFGVTFTTNLKRVINLL